MTARFSNAFQSYLTEPLAPDSGNIKILQDDVARLPELTNGDWCPLNISDPRGYEEIVHVTKIRQDGTLIVKRAMEGTKARSFQQESRVDMRLTAESIDSFLGLYYGGKTEAPKNAPIGAQYLDISRTPNVMMARGVNGWSPAVSFSLGGLRQQTFNASKGEQGPFYIDGGFSTGFANINGLSIYPSHGMTIDTEKSTFKLDKPLDNDALIVFHGYLANDAVDVFTKKETNNLLNELKTYSDSRLNNLKTDSDNSLKKLKTDSDNKYLPKSGGIVSGDINLLANLNLDGTITTNGWITLNGFDAQRSYRGIEFNYKIDKDDYTCQVYHVGSSFRIRYKGYGDVAQFHTNGKAEFSGDIVLANKTTLQTTGNVIGPDWPGGNLKQHIENRINSCVTNVRVDGWAQITGAWGKYVTLPSGYFVNSVYLDGEWGTNTRYAGVQPQVFIKNIGWVPIGRW